MTNSIANIPGLQSLLGSLKSASDALAEVLKEGQLLQVRVTQVISEHEALVQVRGFPAIVQTDSPLLVGQLVEAEVVATRPEVLLKLVTGEPGTQHIASAVEGETFESALKSVLGTFDAADLQAARALRSAGLPVTARTVQELKLVAQGRLSVGETLSELKSLLSRLVGSELPQTQAEKLAQVLSAVEALPVSEEELSSPELARVVRDGGQLLESKLMTLLRDGHVPGDLERDLKWLLFKLNTILEAQGKDLNRLSLTTRTLLQDVSGKVESLLKLVEGAQLQSLRFENYFYFEAPFRDGKDFRKARIEVFRRKGEEATGSQDSSATVVLHLMMSRLGAMRIVLTVVRRNATCAFKVESNAVAEAVRFEAPALQEAFAQRGFRLHDVSCGLFAPHEIPGTLLGDGAEVNLQA